MKANKIKIVLQHFYSKRDFYGNCYWIHKVTNTRTGHSLWWKSPHCSNAEGSVRQAGYEWGDILSCGETELPIRDFNDKKKRLAEELLFDSCNDPKIVKAIKNLRFKVKK